MRNSARRARAPRVCARAAAEAPACDGATRGSLAALGARARAARVAAGVFLDQLDENLERWKKVAAAEDAAKAAAEGGGAEVGKA